MSRLHPFASCVALAVFTLAPAALAQSVVYAPDGAQATIQAAVDALAGPGVVVLPVGKWETLGSVTIATDDVTIIGAGSGSTLLFRSAPPAGADAATFALYTAPFLQAKSAARSRISGVAIRSWPAATGLGDRDVGIRCTECTDFRVDHCDIRFTGNSGVTTSGATHGVVDHCTFSDIYEAPIGNYGYGVSVYGTVHEGEPFGSPRATFIEDSSFDGCRHAVASNRGARYVFRHNHVTNNVVSHAIDTHGAEYPPSPKPDCTPCYEPDPSNPGTEWAEVYDNVIELPGYANSAVGLRGGKGLVFNNTFRGYTLAVRLSRLTPEPTGPVHLWDNTLGAGVSLVQGTGSCCGQGPSWELSALAGYAPYAYPHPLVSDLDVKAGPDMRVMAPAPGMPASVFVDGTGTTVQKGAVDSWRWYASPTPVSECARDVLELGVGTHVLLLAARRNDGLTDVDTAVVEVLPPGPLASAPDWPSLWFAPFPGTATVSFDVTPEAALADAYVGLAGRHDIGDHGDHAAHVRTNNLGFFDARNGDAYAADAQIPYQAGKTYRVEVAFDVGAQTYDVRVDGAALATGYAFRRSEVSIGQVTAWNAPGSGALAVTGLQVEGAQQGPDPACAHGEDAGVDAPAPADGGAPWPDATADAPTPADGSGAAAPSGAGDGGDCACRQHGRGAGSWWSALGLLAALAWFRRRAIRAVTVRGRGTG